MAVIPVAVCGVGLGDTRTAPDIAISGSAVLSRPDVLVVAFEISFWLGGTTADILSKSDEAR